jgi:hypothetical protein
MELMRRRCGSWPFTAGSAGSSEAGDSPGFGDGDRLCGKGCQEVAGRFGEDGKRV